MAAGAIDHLKGHVNEPVVQDAVLAVIRKAEKPLQSGEIAERAGLPISKTCRSLGRLHTQKRVQRWKLPMTFSSIVPNGRRRGERVPSTRMVNVYVIAGDGE